MLKGRAIFVRVDLGEEMPTDEVLYKVEQKR